MRYSPRTIKIINQHAGLMHFGGMWFFQESVCVPQLRNLLTRRLTYPRRNYRYQSSETVIALVYPLKLLCEN
ncbi:MAG TPA: hypothetical protein VEW05_07545 [Candidatus Polarisedimenticolia bacterium]|nr:hypothetical protein [Candidatus Polarisedimenticolia bacterium]